MKRRIVTLKVEIEGSQAEPNDLVTYLDRKWITSDSKVRYVEVVKVHD